MIAARFCTLLIQLKLLARARPLAAPSDIDLCQFRTRVAVHESHTLYSGLLVEEDVHTLLTMDAACMPQPLLTHSTSSRCLPAWPRKMNRVEGSYFTRGREQILQKEESRTSIMDEDFPTERAVSFRRDLGRDERR